MGNQEMKLDDLGMHTIEKQTLKGLLDIELCIENDQSEANGKCIVGCVALEKQANSIESSIVSLLRGWWW
jgi:hypothetical protein